MMAVVEDMKPLSFADRKGRARGLTHEVGRSVRRRKVEFEEVTLQRLVKSYHLEISERFVITSDHHQLFPTKRVHSKKAFCVGTVKKKRSVKPNDDLGLRSEHTFVRRIKVKAGEKQ